MGRVFDLTDRIEALDIKATIVTSVQQTSYEIISFNSEQLNSGIRSDGLTLKPYDPKLKYYGKEYPQYRKEYYEQFKNSLNPNPGLGNPDLFLTGEFYKGIGVVVNANSNSFTVSSSSEKAKRLELRYGSQIYGLTKENKTKYAIDVLQPTLNTNIKNQLGL